MIVVLKHNPNPEQLQSLITWLQEKGIIIHTSIGEGNMLLGLVGDTSKIDADLISALDIVEDVKRVQEPYKNANRKFHPEDTVVKVGNTQIGGGNLTLMAGPCSVESEEQVVAIAKAVKASGATMLRGGAFKPRTSPYSFQGLGEVGLRYLEIAKEETGLPIVTELMDLSQLPLFKNVDVIQIGARNMQNFDLLKAVGRQEKPVMIKRGMSATYEEWLMSAEYVMAGGNENVILCERGVRTFETYTQADAPAHHRRPQPRHRQELAGRPAGDGRGGDRLRRPAHRGPQRPRTRAVRRPAVAEARAVRRAGKEAASTEGIRQDDRGVRL